jgi:hypothetical protein
MSGMSVFVGVGRSGREAGMNAILHENRSHYYYGVTFLP